jgi:hypothetical protein
MTERLWDYLDASFGCLGGEDGFPGADLLLETHIKRVNN